MVLTSMVGCMSAFLVDHDMYDDAVRNGVIFKNVSLRFCKIQEFTAKHLC